MMPVTQQRHRRNLRKQIPRRWLSLAHDRLGILALALVILGLILLLIPVGALQGVGGIVFGTGLTVLISLWSNRQQLAKDANLRRKTEVYGPLHAELQTLRERLEETRAGSKSYLQWINVKGMEPDHAPHPLNEESPRLYCWLQFRADFRNLDFSEPTRQLLNKTQQLATDYNIAVEQALVASEAAFAPCIQTAITRVTQSKEFQQWSENHPYVFLLRTHSVSSPLPNDWFIRILDAVAKAASSPTEVAWEKALVYLDKHPQVAEPASPPTEVAWATWWLRVTPVGYYSPTTLGWLLAGNRDQAVHAIYSVLSSPSGGYPPPPLKWLHAIVDEAWPTLDSHPTYLAVRTLHEELFRLVSQAETKLVDKLRYIQDTYEGGPPPL